MSWGKTLKKLQIAPDGQTNTLHDSLPQLVCECVQEWEPKIVKHFV